MANGNNGNGAPKPVRCAIYTRKSTDEGLNQDFNSLDAQRDAGEAYIRSQAGEGWTLLPDQYDDGGYTGANMDRPALRRLLADIQARKVDCVVVYKVDRLSRSIRDFAKIMEILEKHGATFVSVTQQFNTTTSLGRLTLNILLSFAQFEREIISERTRDKQILARKRGKWTGGHVPLGYDLVDGCLAVNEEEAARVRQIFEWYLGGHSVHGIVAKCEGLGWRNKQWATKEGKTFGGHPLRKCHIYTMLANPLYAARIRAADEIAAAAHPRIVDDNTFDLVQQKLKENTRNPGGEHGPKLEALLRGLLYCAACGSPMSPSYSSRLNRRYRYYVCLRAMQRNGEPSVKGEESTCTFFRPERTDMVILDTANPELRINSASAPDMRKYRELFGLHLFGSAETFRYADKYSLEPLRKLGQASLECSDFPSLESARLTELEIGWGGTFNNTQVEKADDVFMALAVRQAAIPDEPPLKKAKIKVKLKGVKKPRVLSLVAGNKSGYPRGEESALLEDWLRAREFIVYGKRAYEEAA